MALNKGSDGVVLSEVMEVLLFNMSSLGEIEHTKTQTGVKYSIPGVDAKLYVYTNVSGKVVALFFNYCGLSWNSKNNM